MKREGNVWEEFINKENIKKAIINAAKGKRRYRKVRKVLDNIDEYVDKLHRHPSTLRRETLDRQNNQQGQ